MSKDKKEKALKRPIETNFTISYTNENDKTPGNIDNHFVVYDNTYEVVENGDKELTGYKFDIDNTKIYEIHNILTYEGVKYNDNAEYLLPYGLNTLQEQLNSGKSLLDVHTNLIKSLNEEKLNPQVFYYIITFIETQIHNLYDTNTEHKNLGRSSLEMLGNILATKRHDKLDGFVCTNIHEFGMRLLHDCGIDAVVISGKAIESGNHSCLLYQVEDGKYAFTNYNSTVIINAKNIKEASKVVNKACKATGLENFGTISFIDDNCSYQEFALKDETVWGQEIDKRAHNFDSPCNFNLKEKSSIDGSFNISNMGNLSGTIESTFVYDNNVTERETTLGVSIQKMGKTPLFDNSKSAGFKVGHKFLNNNNGLFFGGQAIIAHTTGNINLNTNPMMFDVLDVNATAKTKLKEHKENEVNYNELDDNTKNQINEYYKINHIDNPYTGEKNPAPEPNNQETNEENPKPENKPTITKPQVYTTEHTITSLQAKLGKNYKLLDDKNIQINNTAQVSCIGYTDMATTGSFAFSGDARLAVEDGLQLIDKGQNSIFKTYISGGILGDLKYTGGSQKGGVQFGMKANAGIEGALNLNKNFNIGGSVDTYLVETKPTTEKGISTKIHATYKPAHSNISFFGDFSNTKETQKLRIGRFDQLAEDTNNIGITLGIQNPNGKISLSYNNNVNGTNTSYNSRIFSLNVSTTPQNLFNMLGIK